MFFRAHRTNDLTNKLEKVGPFECDELENHCRVSAKYYPTTLPALYTITKENVNSAFLVLLLVSRQTKSQLLMINTLVRVWGFRVYALDKHGHQRLVAHFEVATSGRGGRGGGASAVGPKKHSCSSLLQSQHVFTSISVFAFNRSLSDRRSLFLFTLPNTNRFLKRSF